MSLLRLLLLGGAHRELRLAARLAQDAGAQVRLAEDAAEALAFARKSGADLILADVSSDVPALLAALRRERIGVPVLACGVDVPATAAVAAVRAGAVDFLPLPPSRELIAAALLSVGERRTSLVGAHPAFRSVLIEAERLAPSSTPMLITGAPGTGRQALGRHVHALSGRVGHLVLVDPTSGQNLEELSSEIFGHRAGEFDGALADRPGKLREAAGGTLLIRHSDALPAAIQLRLRSQLRAAGVRILLTAASRDGLHPELARDLAAFQVVLPPLRDRGDDVLRIAGHFISRFAADEGLAPPQLAPCAIARLRSHNWPGNVAELEALVQRAVLLADGGAIRAGDFGIRAARPEGEALRVEELVGRSVEEVERALILRTLARCNGNRTSASAILGISVRTMRNKLRAFQQSGTPLQELA